MIVNEETRVGLKEWRIAAGITQAELAEKAGVSQATLSRVERGGEPSTVLRRRLNGVVGRGVLRYGGKRDTLAYLIDVDPDAPRKPLRWWRVTRSMSSMDLELASGISARTINNIEKGATIRVHPSTRRALAKALMVHPTKLVLPGDENVEEFGGESPDVLSYTRAELRSRDRVLRRAYDFLRDGANVTHRAQDERNYSDLLGDIERELRGT